MGSSAHFLERYSCRSYTTSGARCFLVCSAVYVGVKPASLEQTEADKAKNRCFGVTHVASTGYGNIRKRVYRFRSNRWDGACQETQIRVKGLFIVPPVSLTLKKTGIAVMQRRPVLHVWIYMSLYCYRRPLHHTRCYISHYADVDSGSVWTFSFAKYPCLAGLE